MILWNHGNFTEVEREKETLNSLVIRHSSEGVNWVPQGSEDVGFWGAGWSTGGEGSGTERREEASSGRLQFCQVLPLGLPPSDWEGFDCPSWLSSFRKLLGSPIFKVFMGPSILQTENHDCAPTGRGVEQTCMRRSWNSPVSARCL